MGVGENGGSLYTNGCLCNWCRIMGIEYCKVSLNNKSQHSLRLTVREV